MKKLISIILVSLMIATCLPLAAIPTFAATNVCKIGSVGYDSLAAAIKNVKNGETITILANCEIADHKVTGGANGISYTIDGSNKAYTIKAKKSSGYVTTGNNNVTYKNAKIVIENTYENSLNATGNITFDGCEITSDIAPFRHCGTGTFTFKNSNVTGNSGTPLLFLRTNSKGKIVIDGSTLTQAKGFNNAHLGNNSVIHINNSAKVSQMTYDIEIKNGSVLQNTSPSTSGSKAACLIKVESPEAVVNITASSDSSLILNSASTALTESHFISSSESPTIASRISLSGTPKFIASAYVVSKGVYMPNIVHKNGSVRYTNSWSANGGAAFKISSDKATAKKYTATVSGNVTFTPVDTKLTASNAAAGVRKFDGVIEYYSSIDEAKYRTNANEAFVFVNDYTYSDTQNILSGFFGDTKVINYTLMGVDKGSTKVKLSLPGDIPNNEWDYYYGGIRNVTFENLNVISNHSFDTDPEKTGGSLSFIKCDVQIKSDFRITNANTVNITDSTFTSTHNPCMFYLRNNSVKAKGVINVKNSHLKYEGSGAANNACIFHVNGTYAVEINVTNSTLESHTKAASNAHIVYAEKNTDPVALNFDNASTLYLNGQTASTGGNYFIAANTDATLFKSEVRIKGTPTFKVNKNIAAGGFSFTPNCKDMNGTVVAYASESKLYPNTVAKTTISSDMSFSPVYITDKDFAIIKGAEVREDGIRFSAKVSNTLASDLGNNATFGMIIAHNTYADGNEIDLELANPKYNPLIAVSGTSNKSLWEKGDTHAIYRMALINVPNKASAYVTKLAARGYFTVNYADGSSATFYTTFDKSDNVRSMYSVAYNLYRKNKTSPITDAIANTVIA